MCCTHLHNHISTQNSTLFIHIEWEPVNWHRLTDGPTHPPPTLCDKPAVRNALLMIKPHWRIISTKINFSVMGLLIKNTWKHIQTFAGNTFQSSNIFYYQWCGCVCMYMCGVHVCVWCPYVVTAVLSSLFIFWSYFIKVVFHTSWHMMHTTWPTHNIIINPPFGHFFPLLLIYFNDFADSYNHIPTQK